MGLGGRQSKEKGESGEYEEQLKQLREMGFEDETASLSALRTSDGDVDTAIGLLLGGL